MKITNIVLNSHRFFFDMMLQNIVECVGVFMEPCFVVRGGVTAYSVGKSSEMVEEEISSEIYEILDSGDLEESLIDIDAIRSLRAPSMTLPAAPTIPTATLPSNPSPTDTGTQPLEVPPTSSPVAPPNSFSFPTPAPVSTTDGSPSDGSPTIPATNTTIEGDEETPFILKFPWWGWLSIALGVVLIVVFKVAVDKMLEQNDSDSEQRDSVSE